MTVFRVVALGLLTRFVLLVMINQTDGDFLILG